MRAKRAFCLKILLRKILAVKIASAGEGTRESNCLSPRTKAPRAQGRARRSIRTHGGRTSDGKEMSIIDKQNASEASILLKNFASQNFGLCARFAGFLRRKQLMSPYIFLGDSKLRVNSWAVKIPLFLGKSRLRVGRNA